MMERQERKILKYVEPRPGLLKLILARIEAEQRKIFLRHYWLSWAALVASLALFVPSFAYLWKGLAQSGTWQFTSLVFSDWTVVAADWKDFILTVIEALPLASLGATLFLVFTILFSLRDLLKNKLELINFKILRRV